MDKKEEEKETLLGLYVNINAGTVEPCYFKDDLKEFYRLLNCRTIDIQEARIEGRLFDFIVDDEALLKEGPKPSAFTKDKKPAFCGNLLICRCDTSIGKEISLTKEDITLLLSKVVEIANREAPEEPRYKGLWGLEF